jgi:hypothetical protein
MARATLLMQAQLQLELEKEVQLVFFLCFSFFFFFSPLGRDGGDGSSASAAPPAAPVPAQVPIGATPVAWVGERIGSCHYVAAQFAGKGK